MKPRRDSTKNEGLEELSSYLSNVESALRSNGHDPEKTVRMLRGVILTLDEYATRLGGRNPDILFDTSNPDRIRVGDKYVPLTLLESRLIDYMIRNKGRIFSKKELLAEVWEPREYKADVVRATIRQLREKGVPYIKNHRGFGYSINLDDCQI